MAPVPLAAAPHPAASTVAAPAEAAIKVAQAETLKAAARRAVPARAATAAMPRAAQARVGMAATPVAAATAATRSAVGPRAATAATREVVRPAEAVQLQAMAVAQLPEAVEATLLPAASATVQS